LREQGLGSTWRWVPRARLGDEAWMAALVRDWGLLSPPLRIQAMDAAGVLPETPRALLRDRLRPMAERAGGQVQKLWEGL